SSVKPVKNALLHHASASTIQLAGVPSSAGTIATGTTPTNAIEPNSTHPAARTVSAASGADVSACAHSEAVVDSTWSQTHAAPRSPRAATKSPAIAAAQSGEVKRASSRCATGSLDTGTSREIESVHQSFVRLKRPRERLHANRGNCHVALRAPAALRRGIAHAGRDG